MAGDSSAKCFFAFFFQGLVDTTIINKIPARIYFGVLGYGMAAYRKES